MTSLGILLFFSVVMGTFAHEMYHVWDASENEMEIMDVCILGYHPQAGVVGWVHHVEIEGFSPNEGIPTILGIVVSLWCYFGLLKVFIFKRPPKEGTSQVAPSDRRVSPIGKGETDR